MESTTAKVAIGTLALATTAAVVLAVSSRSRSRKKPTVITKHNVAAFLEEFDALLSDCDGVIWSPTRPHLPKAREGLESLRAAGKKVLFVTNNSVIPPMGKFEKFGFAVAEDEVVHPALALTRHLQDIGFQKKVFVIGVENFKDPLRRGGFNVVPERRIWTHDIGNYVKLRSPGRGSPRMGRIQDATLCSLTQAEKFIEENFRKILNGIQDDLDIGAVVIDLDFNLDYMILNVALNILRRPDCLFFAGATDPYVTQEDGKIVLGPGHFLSALEATSGRTATRVGKPGPMMVTSFLKDVHGLNLKRSVFVGDSLVQDMGVANACGMKKLLVLTGVTQLEDLDQCDPKLVPDFVIDSVGTFADLLPLPAAVNNSR